MRSTFKFIKTKSVRNKITSDLPILTTNYNDRNGWPEDQDRYRYQKSKVMHIIIFNILI
ncbi:hypothetical protein LCGC14_1337450 [marine sediment metagenome]|uniref:Uncharacterized protein n=1 Tax=marine sediment metagenome TaxID=412755 RepID=A0A0F9MVJ0_9ZZZZ